MVVVEVSLENCNSFSYRKQGLFYTGVFLDIALLIEFYFVHYISSISLSFLPAHLCCCGSSERMRGEGLLLVVMLGLWWDSGLALKKRKIIPGILREYFRVHNS